MAESDVKGYSLLTGVSISLILSLLYVGLIYVNADIITDRNDPKVIRQRISKIGIFTALTVAILPSILSRISETPVEKIYSQFGVFGGLDYTYEKSHFKLSHLTLVIKDIIHVLLLVSLLYIGPLIDKLFFEDDSNLFDDLIRELRTIHGIRDLIVGPVTEETIYTAATIVILNQVETIEKSTLIFLPPVFFSFAHFHHAFQLYLKKIPLNVIILSTIFQLAYTFLFGIFTNFIFLRTDNLYAVILIHSFCNFIGVPKFTVDTKKFKYWNYTYYSLLLLGIYLFKASLFILSESSLALTPRRSY